jgi:hypothetical protein
MPIQVLFPLMERMPNTYQRQSQFEDIEKSRLRAWLLVTKMLVSHAVSILDSHDGIEKIWFHLMSMHEKQFVEAKTILLKSPLRDQLLVVFSAAKNTKLAENPEALQRTWSILEKSTPDAKDIFEACGRDT